MQLWLVPGVDILLCCSDVTSSFSHRMVSACAKSPRTDDSAGLAPLLRGMQGRCVICGGPGVSDAYYCKECTIQEKDRDGCECMLARRFHPAGCCIFPLARTLRAIYIHTYIYIRRPLLTRNYHVDRPAGPKIVNLGSSKTDLFYERKKYGFKQR